MPAPAHPSVPVREPGGVPGSTDALHNRYFVLRHGQSSANVERLIASSVANAGAAFGLTRLGREQVRQSITEAKARGTLTGECRIVSSPLLRARESADVASEVLGTEPALDARLIERSFGTLEMSGDEQYEKVWAEDARDPDHALWGVESLRAIARRLDALVGDLERDGQGRDVVLCTHGDVASTLCCISLGIALNRHREVGALANGELRALPAGARRR